jgi:hypothetical protein
MQVAEIPASFSEFSAAVVAKKEELSVISFFLLFFDGGAVP